MFSTKLTGGHSGSVLCVAVQPQTGKVVSGAEGGELCCWSPDGQLMTKITRPDSDCTSVIFSKNNPSLIYASFGQEILILDIQRVQEPVFIFQSNQDEVNQIVLDAQEQFLAACDDSGEIKIYGLQDRKVFKTLRHKHTNICSSLVFRPGRVWEIVSGGLDNRVIHWDFSRLKCLNQFNMQELHATPGDSSYMVNPPFVHHVAASPSGTTFACALENGQLPILDATHKNLRPKYSIFGHSHGASQVCFIDENNIVSAGNDSCIVKWDLTKSDLYQPADVVMNGDSNHASPDVEKNLAITELCKARTFTHPCKVNWMALRCLEADRAHLFVADQTSDISILDLS